MNNHINLSVKDFENNSQAELFQKIVDEIYEREIDLNKIDDFENPLKNLIYILNMHFQVMNGGVIQFVDNSTGDYFKETLLSLKEINADKYVRILEKIKEKFPNRIIPKNTEERRNLIDTICENLTQEQEWELDEFYESLDNEYCENQDELELIIIGYIKKLINKTERTTPCGNHKPKVKNEI
jgi:hypothetical protein